MTVDLLIERAGGREDVCRRCGVGPAALRKWRQHGVIPGRHWRTLVVMSEGRLSYADLESVSAPDMVAEDDAPAAPDPAREADAA